MSFGSEDIEFDFSYLAHPTAVTGIQWRKTHQGEHSVEHILYTTCADNKVRIWTASDPHGLQILQLWAEIDLQESIQPRNPQSDDRLSTRLVFFIDSADFQNAIKHVKKDIEDKPVLEHLVEIAELSPEVCVVLDDNGHMCAWGLQNVGGKVRNPSDIFNIAYVENFDIFSPHARATESENITVLNFSSSNVASYSILLHHFDGRIVWLEGTMLDFFDPSLRSRRLHSNSLWTGHEGAIKKIVRTVGGRAIVSRTNDNDGLIWKQIENQADMALTRCSAFSSHEHVHRTCLLMGGKFMVNLHPTSVSLWNTSDYRAEMVDSCEYKTDGKPLCLIQLPSPVAGMTSRYLATITSTMKGIVWVARLPQNEKVNGTLESVRPSIKQFCTFDLGDDRDLSYVLPIDPAGSRPPIGGFLDTFAKDIALSYTETGVIHTWAAQVKPESGSIGWLATANIATGINSPTLASGSSIRKIALVDSARNGLTIWDTRSSQLEYDKDFGEGYTIQDLDWTSTPDDQSILAVGFPHRVMILAQIRYDYLDRGPAWAPIREIYIRESTPHPIGDSTWLGSGSLVIGAGNQLFAYGKLITTSDEMVSDLAIPTHSHASLNLFDVVSLLNGPLPIFHPQLLSQCILAGKLHQVENVILKLNKELKFFSDGESLDSFLSIPAEQFFVERQVCFE